MQRSSIKTPKYKTNVERAAKVIADARTTVLNSRRGIVAPPRTGGFFGAGSRPRGSGPELKSVDVTAAAATMATSAVTGILLNGLATGSDIGSRIGRKVTMKSLLLRIHFSPVASVDSPIGCTARALVVWDSQTNTVATTSTLVLNTDDFLAPNKLENRERFTILMDKFITLPAAEYTAPAVTAGAPTPRLLKKYLRINRDTIYNANSTGAVGDIVSGSLYLVVIASSATYQFQVNSRVRFTD